MISINEGRLDRLFRGVSGVVLLLFGLSGVAALGWSLVFDVVGLVLFLTAVAGYCPLYSVFGFDTCHHRG